MEAQDRNDGGGASTISRKSELSFSSSPDAKMSNCSKYESVIHQSSAYPAEVVKALLYKNTVCKKHLALKLEHFEAYKEVIPFLGQKCALVAM